MSAIKWNASCPVINSNEKTCSREIVNASVEELINAAVAEAENANREYFNDLSKKKIRPKKIKLPENDKKRKSDTL